MAALTIHALALGDSGRFVIPIEVRERHGWGPGENLIAIDTDEGLLLMSVSEGLARLRGRLEGRDLVQELLDERRAEVAAGSSLFPTFVDVSGADPVTPEMVRGALDVT